MIQIVLNLCQSVAKISSFFLSKPDSCYKGGTDAFSVAIDFEAEGYPLWLVACGNGFLQPLQ